MMAETIDRETREAILAAIKGHAEASPTVANTLRLAEAYAWIIRPDQSHGTSTS